MKKILIQSTITLIFLLTNSSSDNINDSNYCPESYYFSIKENKCISCNDSNCLSCYESKESKKCIKCKENYYITGIGICGEKCSKNSIKNCKYCYNSLNECIQCKAHCSLKNNKCNCFELYILIFVCIFIAVVTIGIVLYCLSSSSLIYKMAKIHLNQMRIIVHNDRFEWKINCINKISKINPALSENDRGVYFTTLRIKRNDIIRYNRKNNGILKRICQKDDIIMDIYI